MYIHKRNTNQEDIMATTRRPRIYQTVVTVTNHDKVMRMAFASVEAARADIASSVAFGATDPRGQEVWGRVTSAAIVNKETGETVEVLV
jgi:hypothetical protein